MLHFAAAGSPASTPGSGGSLAGLTRAHELGITAMELEWVQRVPANADHVEEVGILAAKLDIKLTIHAPYFVNLNAQEPEKLQASIKRVLNALAMAQVCGARSVCVHPAFYLGMEPTVVYENVRAATDVIMKKKDLLFPNVNLGYETMGKPTQFGTLEECLALSKEFGLYPVIDPAHMHARTNGQWNTTQEFEEMLDIYESYLGTESLQHVHFHYSGIEYTIKGERRHLPLPESDARWKEFLLVLKKRNVSGVVVVESPLQEIETLLMKDTYAKL